MRSTGLVLAAGGIAAANQVFLEPAANGGDVTDVADNFNWRLIPATLLLAALFGGFETLAPDFAVGLAGLTVLAVMVVDTKGGTHSPIENAATLVQGLNSQPVTPATPATPIKQHFPNSSGGGRKK